VIDTVGEDLKRLIAFNGLKITNIEVEDFRIQVNLKYKRKNYYLIIENNEMILYDADRSIVCKVKPKIGAITWTTAPWQTVSTGNTWADTGTYTDASTWIMPSTAVGNILSDTAYLTSAVTTIADNWQKGI
jgi:hypothetical protein